MQALRCGWVVENDFPITPQTHALGAQKKRLLSTQNIMENDKKIHRKIYSKLICFDLL